MHLCDFELSNDPLEPEVGSCDLHRTNSMDAFGYARGALGKPRW